MEDEVDEEEEEVVLEFKKKIVRVKRLLRVKKFIVKIRKVVGRKNVKGKKSDKKVSVEVMEMLGKLFIRSERIKVKIEVVKRKF